MSNEAIMQLLEFLKQGWKRDLTTSSIWLDLLRTIGWGIIRGLRFVVGALQELLNKVYSLMDYSDSVTFQTIFPGNSGKVIIFVLLGLSLAALGWMLIWYRDKERPKVMYNIIVLLICLTSMPSLMGLMNNLVRSANDVVFDSSENSFQQEIDEIIAVETIDLSQIFKPGVNEIDSSYEVKDNGKIYKDGKLWKGIEASEVEDIIEYSKINAGITDNNHPATKYIVSINDEGEYEVVERTPHTGLNIFNTDSFVYRYKVSWIYIMICELAFIFVVFFMVFKVGRIIYELLITQTIAPLFATEISSGKKIKAIFENMISLYYVLFLTMVFLKIFCILNTVISQHFENGIVKLFLLIVITWATIDGPNLVQRILGIDAGLSSGWKVLSAGFMVGRTVSRGGEKIAGIGKSHYNHREAKQRGEAEGEWRDKVATALGVGKTDNKGLHDNNSEKEKNGGADNNPLENNNDKGLHDGGGGTETTEGADDRAALGENQKGSKEENAGALNRNDVSGTNDKNSDAALHHSDKKGNSIAGESVSSRYGSGRSMSSYGNTSQKTSAPQSGGIQTQKSTTKPTINRSNLDGISTNRERKNK